MKVALVHDYLIQYGGGERVLEAFAEIFPKAPIYTLIYDKKLTREVFENRRIYTSFLQRIPLAKTHHRLFLTLMPLAIEQFDLSSYDLILSDSASFSKGVITKPKTLHICYCHTPLRYAWDDSHRYIEEFYFPGFIKKFIPLAINYLRIWDRVASQRVDKFIANSNFVKKRISKYYGQEAEVIYPPVNTSLFSSASDPENYFLMVGRFLPYKRFDLAIKVFNKLGIPLKIIGSGPEEKKLKKIANFNIEFLGKLSDQAMKDYYQHCQALIFPQEEDLGITALEAMAAGRPVIAYRGGGACETVIEGKTGIFFDEQSPQSLETSLSKFNPNNFNSKIISAHARQFDKEIFKKKIKEFLENTWQEFNHGV